ncbi:MAG: hypothetical protein K2J42_07115 [Muribaculaceae bacterium]|nr:hypothetical protein [Muribaculaceae bacterium]MDE6809838.1 hypothetical protein [Muribaculaceae bacterium]
MEDLDERKRLAKRREEIAEKNRELYREFLLSMDEERKKALELMRRRHAYYTKLITDAEIKTAQDFFDRYREHFLMYGIDLSISDDKSYCSIYLELGDYDYENYGVMDGKNGNLAEISPYVSFKELFNNVEVNIFTEEEV